MKKYLLVVEDENTIAKILKSEILNSIPNVEVEVIPNGSNVMDKIKQQKPDLILLDLLLPGKTGMEILKDIRESEKTKDIKVMILSNLKDNEHIGEAVRLGVSSYLIKSDHSLSEIMDKINLILS